MLRQSRATNEYHSMEYATWRRCTGVYSIIERPKLEGYWLNIGVAFPHEKGDGFNVMQQALPLHGNGKLVTRAYEPEAHETQDCEKHATPR